MAYLVVSFTARDLDRDSLREVLARQVSYDTRRQRRARHMRWCGALGSVALACWRSGLWPAIAVAVLLMAVAWCASAFVAEWLARLQLDATISRIPATTMHLPKIGSPPTVP